MAADTSAVRALPGFLCSDELAQLAEIARGHASAFEPGRQKTGYQKLAVKDDHRLAALIDRSLALLEVPRSSSFWDAWLLCYPRGSMIPPHTDAPDAAGVGHHRLNALVAAATHGGVLSIDGAEVPLVAGDGLLFRPDLQVHAVSEIVVGERLVWSVGCWKAPDAAPEDAASGVE